MNSVPAGIELSTPDAARDTGLAICQGYVPGLVGWVSGMHGIYYAGAWGSGAPFEIQMAREFSDFIEHFQPARDLVLAACLDGRIVGAIAILGGHPEAGGVQLRFFIVDEGCQGQGVGSRLLAAALQWCDDHGHEEVFLWTVDGLPQSRHLYEKNGFRIVERHWDERYTVPREALRMVREGRPASCCVPE